ncbi:MAG: anthranilate synthase component 2 [Psychromonas sp.]|jgi:anthranilate synthase component 2
MKIAVIDNFDSFVYNLVRYLREFEGAEITVMRNNNIDRKVLDKADAILLSPGPGIPSEAGELMRVIEEYHQSKKILGVCLGHQAIGEFFGAKLELCQAAMHGKSSSITISSEDSFFDKTPDKIDVGRYHSWQLSDQNMPNVLKIIGKTDKNEIMAIRHKILPLYGVQFHPESILTPLGRTLINNWIKN